MDPAPAPGPLAAAPASRAKKWVKRAIHAVILVLTLAAISWNAIQAANEVHTKQLEFDLGWLAASAGFYWLGLALLGLPWWLALDDCRAGIRLASAVRVYLISHVGKYVPGKAMVIIIRCGLLQRWGVPVGIVVLTSFYETFMTMASGSLLAVVCWRWLPFASGRNAQLEQYPLLAAALPFAVIGLAAGFLGAILPPVFRRLTCLVTLPMASGARTYADQRFTLRTVVLGLSAGALSWLIQGASYLAAVNAIAGEKLPWSALPTTTATIALSIVVGFLSMLPGQVGVREVILIATLEPLVGDRRLALAAPLLHRLVTIVCELFAGLVLYLGGRR